MSDLEHVGTLPISNGTVKEAVRVRIYAPNSRKLEWFTDLDEMIAKGYSPLKMRATKAWVVYGKDLTLVSGVIRGNLEIALEDIPESAEIAVVSGKYNNSSTGIEVAKYNGLGNATINSTFMRKYDGREINISQKPVPHPQKVIPYTEQSIPTKIAAPRIPHPQVPAKPSVPTVIAPKVVPKIAPKPIDPKEEHHLNQAHMTSWERARAAATNEPSSR